MPGDELCHVEPLILFPKMPGMEQIETILEIGSEGGSLTILGKREPGGGWKFVSKRNETTLCNMLPEEEQSGLVSCESSGWVNSLTEALVLLDRYPWHRLCPMKVHQEFRQAIHDAVVSRYKASGNERAHQLSKWQEVCANDWCS